MSSERIALNILKILMMGGHITPQAKFVEKKLEKKLNSQAKKEGKSNVDTV